MKEITLKKSILITRDIFYVWSLMIAKWFDVEFDVEFDRYLLRKSF